jgi:hypothetical protein
MERVVGIILSPRKTYAAVVAYPRVLGVMLLVVAITISASFMFFSTDVGKEAFIDVQMRRMESIGRRVSDAQYVALERLSAYAAWVTASVQLLAIPILSLGVAVICLVIFNAMLGGNASFKQVLAVVAHAQIPMALQQLLALPLDYAQGSVSSPTSLNVFLPVLDDTSFSSHLAGSIDLIWIWVIVNLSIGFGVLYKRRARPIAVTGLAVYLAAAVVFAAARAALSGA